MVMKLFILGCLVVWAGASSLRKHTHHSRLDGKLHFSDVILADSTSGSLVRTSNYKFHVRNVITSPSALWTNGKIPFEFDPALPAFAIVEMLAAMQEIEMSVYSGGKPCIMFVPKTNEHDYVHISFTDGPRGSANIGRAGGRQDTVINQISSRGHDDNLKILLMVIGLIPEVMRSDRNTYINIDLGNAVSTDPFRILTGQGTSTFGQSFDFESLLLEGPYTYARNSAFPVTSAKVAGKVMGQSVSLSPGDANLVQHAYNCPVDATNVVDLLGQLPVKCNFHTDICNFVQDTTDNFDWIVQTGPTTTAGTGPAADFSSGSGKFVLAEARNHHNQVARLLTPTLGAGQYCLRAQMHAFGPDVGSIRMSVKASGGVDVTINNQQGPLPSNDWFHIYLTLDSKVDFQVQFEVTMGNGDQGDIALDDIYMYYGQCIQWD
ncbi:MAM and LDL-receptor class A domain-containing protein 1-like [Dreissena polymorpha]|uniref:Uncharacterized protein n=1 Tax=Dreissena polymorpha TaxID=45954 RepID=A0A9D4RQ45_DREPO|nr:MAM and LDL-receptor class A domain-containing protein 1-like [Dreissena polymorpha]KAH3876794.1 hypothetical protein DPMN_000644 [Dreissena polymorpha]